MRRSRVSSSEIGTGALAPPAQHVGQQRMARVLQVEALAEARNRAIEIVGETRLAEDQFQLGHGDQSLPDGIAVGAQAVGHLQQDAVDLAHLLFGEAHQFVVEVDGFQRLHKQRVPAGTRGMNHAIDLAALSGNHRNHEALVADGDELLLQHAFLAVGAQEALQRFVNRFLLPLDIAAQAAQRDAGMVGHAAVGQDLAVQFAQQGAKLADGRGAPSQQRKALGGRGQVRLGVGGDIQQREQLEDFLGLQPGAFDAQFVHRGFHVGDAAELDAQRGAAPAGLRMHARRAGIEWPLRLRRGRCRVARGRRSGALSPVRVCPAGSRCSGPPVAAGLRIPELQRLSSSEPTI